MSCSGIVSSCGTWQPALASALDEIDRALDRGEAAGARVTAEVFATIESISLDYGVMEHADRVRVVPSDFGWNDVGHWAASNGDRSENGDYLYGKKRLREIDRRIRFLTKRLEIAEVTDPSVHHGRSQVFFGATVTYVEENGVERTVTIRGIDEADSLKGEVSWVSPIARTLLKSSTGDVLKLVTPQGWREIEVLDVTYPAPSKPSIP